MPNRNKSWLYPGPVGTLRRTYESSILENSTFTAIRAQGLVNDVVGNYLGDNNLEVDKWEQDSIPVGGSYEPTGVPYTMRMSGVTPNYFRGFKDHLPGWDGGSLLSLNTAAIAKTNPSRGGDLNLAVSIGELRELPKLLKQAHQLLVGKLNPKHAPKHLGSAYLQGQFGWAPIFKDIVNLIDVMEKIDERYEEIREHLTSPKGWRHTVKLRNFNDQLSRKFVPVDAYSIGSLSGSDLITTKSRAWGQVVYRPSGGAPPKTDKQLKLMAREAVTGIRLDASTAWNLLPWSWMVDWFTNVGDSIEASRNVSGYYVDRVLIMRSVDTVYHLHDVKPSAGQDGAQIHFCTGGSGIYKRMSRYRHVMPPNFLPSVDVPTLSARQLSTLGALGIQQFR